ncbi:MAG TPA: hypothetical protein ENJ23_04660 [Bacteroidetes bacterium]|nr:hypothetical protein [Bacteroidota bacterium]
MRLKWAVLGVLLLAGLIGRAEVRAQSVPLPMSHWAYELLDRLEAKKLLLGFLPNTRPYSRLQVAQAVAPLLKNPLPGLNSVEREELRYLAFELREELETLGVEPTSYRDSHLEYLRYRSFLRHLLPDFVLKNHRDLVALRTGNLQLYGDLVLHWHQDSRDYSFQDDQRIARERHGVFVRGVWGTRAQFYFQFRDGTEWGGNYPRDNPTWSFEGVGYANAKGSLVYFDETNSGIFFGGGHWQLMVGKQRNRWGPGWFGALALSDHATSYDQVQLQLSWPRVRFTAFTGFLKIYPPIAIYEYDTGYSHRIIHANRYLAAHRLEFLPFRWLVIGLHETLIYGERNLELAYLNPINFYWSAEHYLGDQDNSAIGGDFTLFPGHGVKLYGELFLDDLRTGKLGSDFYGNKWAYLLGTAAYDLLGADNLDFHAEFVRIRPFVYSHRYPINVYKHFTTGLGHWSGPNSQTLSLGVVWRPRRRVRLFAEWEHWQHGANSPDENAGGDFNLPHRLGDPLEVPLLGGILEQRRTLLGEVKLELFRNAYLILALSTHNLKNWPAGDGLRRHGTLREWKIGFSWNE